MVQTFCCRFDTAADFTAVAIILMVTWNPNKNKLSHILQNTSCRKDMAIKIARWCSMSMNEYNLNSHDARGGIFLLIWSITSLLMAWLLKSPGHQQAWYLQYSFGDMYGCSIMNLVFFCWIKCKVWHEMWMHFLWTLIQFGRNASCLWHIAGIVWIEYIPHLSESIVTTVWLDIFGGVTSVDYHYDS